MKFRKNSADSREAFLTRGEADLDSRLGHIEILPGERYDEVLAAVSERHLEPGGDWSNLTAWRSGDAVELCLTGTECFINCREGVPALYPSIDLCLAQVQWKYQKEVLPALR